MTTAPPTPLELAPGVHAWLPATASWGHANCGLVIGRSQATMVVDTPYTTGLARDFHAWAVGLGARVRYVVNTHANGDHCWGNSVFADDGVEFVASAAMSRTVHEEISPAAMVALAEAQGPLGAYTKRFFGGFDFTDIEVVEPTRTFTGDVELDLGGRVVRLLEVGPAHTDGDIIVHAPDAGVVFAGDILFIGDHPVMWTGPIAGWIAACDRLLATGARVVVPGHGPVTDPAGVRAVKSYFETLGEYAERQHAAGVPYAEAADQFPLDRWAQWGHPERLVVTLGTAYANLDRRPPNRAELLPAMAALYWRKYA